MEVKERKCGGFLMSCGQDGNLEEALSPPIQWKARKREEALPNSSNASEPEPGGDEKHDLERDPSEGMPPWKGRSKRKLSQEAAKRPTKGERHNRNKRKTERRQKTTRKERRENKQKPNQANNTKGTADKQARSSYLTLWWKVLMLNQKLVRDCLAGAPPCETQRECTNELIGSDLVEHEKLGRHPWWRCGSVSGNHWVGRLEGKLKRVKGLERYWLVLDKSAPRVLFRA